MNPFRHFIAACSALLILIPGAAWADNVVNDVVTLDESVSLQVGQQATVTLKLNATSGQGDATNGCNLNTSGGEKLVLSVNNSNSSVASGVANPPSPSPSSVEFTQCATGAPGANTGPGGTRTVTVTANAVGQTTFTFTRTSTNGAGEVFSTSQATFNVIVTAPPPPADDEDPVVTVGTPSGANGAGWYNAAISVPVSASDNIGVTSFTCTLDGTNVSVTNPGTVAVGEGTHTVACEAADEAGNTGSDSEEFKVDATDPVVAVTPPATGLSAAGWYKTDPISVDVSATDANLTSFSCTLDGNNVTVTNPGTVSVPEGTHTVACEAADVAGNTGSDSEDVKIDATEPTISHTLNKTANNILATNGKGWFNEDVTADFTCADQVGLSGIANCEPDHTFTQGYDQSFTGKATDYADNEATDPITGINVDTTKPELNIAGRDSGTYDICTTGGPIARPTFAPSDNLSGIQSSSDSWTPPSTSTGVGSYVYTATAKDNADNETNGGRNYTLNYGSAAYSGVLQPINTDGTSRFKLGSTVPVKFRLACNGVAISGADASLTVKKYDGSADPGTDEAISTSAATTGNKFRWSSTDQQYIFNLSTKAGYTNPGSSTPIAFTNGTWTLTINLDDGTKRSFNLNLVK